MPYLNRAISYEALGVEAAERGDAAGAAELWRKALADCSRAVELDPQEFAAWFDRCAPPAAPLLLPLWLPQRPSSVHVVPAATCPPPPPPPALAAPLGSGNVDMRLGDYEQALTDFTTAADLAPGLAGYRLRAATLAFQAGDTAGAKRTMAGVARKNGRYAEAHACLAAVEWAEVSAWVALGWATD